MNRTFVATMVILFITVVTMACGTGAARSTVIPRPTQPLTIANMVQVSWPTAMPSAARFGRWANPTLAKAEMDGRIVFADLGPTITVDEKVYAVQNLVIPMVWSVDDEKKNDKPAQKISFTSNLIMNVVAAHDDLLAGWTADGSRVVVSKTLFRQLSPVSRRGNYYTALVYSAVVRLPKVVKPSGPNEEKP